MLNDIEKAIVIKHLHNKLKSETGHYYVVRCISTPSMEINKHTFIADCLPLSSLGYRVLNMKISLTDEEISYILL